MSEKRRKWIAALLASAALNLALFAVLPALTRQEVEATKARGTKDAVRVALARRLPRTDVRPEATPPKTAETPPPPAPELPPPPMDPMTDPPPPEPIPAPEPDPPDLSFEIDPEIDLGAAVPPPPPPKKVVKKAPPKPKPAPKPEPKKPAPKKPKPAPTPPTVAQFVPAALSPAASRETRTDPNTEPTAGAPSTARPSQPAKTAASGAETGPSDRAPRLLRRVEPEYPRRARRRRVQGIVVANLLVDDKGRVREVNIVQARPKGYFEASVKRALAAWRFEPGIETGKPAAVWVRQSIQFQLKN